MNIYEDLLRQSSELRHLKEENIGMDSFLLPNTIRVASLGDLSEFFRVSSDTLIHKSVKDLWRVSEDEGGKVVIERLFNPNTKEALKV